MIYTGIGSRETPKEVLEVMFKCGRYFGQLGFTLRSGKAQGADTAFEEGVYQVNGSMEIYIPWKTFTGNRIPSKTLCIQPSKESMTIAESIHPAWERCSQGAKLLHNRNVYQVLGKDLNTPSNFVLYWAEVKYGRVQGGTATAVNLAISRGIPTINMNSDNWKLELRKLLNM